jgi:hypothetical protein
MEFEAFESEAPVSDAELSLVARLAEEQVKLEKDIERYETYVGDLKKRLKKISETDLPTALEEIGLASITLTNGATVVIEQKMFASISKKNKPKAVQWMIDHGQEALVKTGVAVLLDKGEQEKLERLRDLLDHSEFTEYSLDTNVHTGAVKAMINEMVAQGIDVPLELFGAHYVKKSVVSMG